ncbi:Hypothetical protein ERS075591_00716 [Mycobacteroides abscessus]|nr:Hypothetical protein ERS075591_00716 [Mycobacteroides abscessus]
MKFSVGPLAVALVTVSGIAVFPAIGSAEPEPPTPTPASETNSRTAILPVFAQEGIRVRTGKPGELLTIHLPDDVPLAPAQWGPDGDATYRAADTEYTVTPLIDGGDTSPS